MFGASRRSLLHTLERERNAHERQVAQLLDVQARLVEQLCVLAGKPAAAPSLSADWLSRDARAEHDDLFETDLVDVDQLP